MFEWVWQNIQGISAALAAIGVIGGAFKIWVWPMVRVMILSTRRFNTFVDLLEPKDGSPNLREVLQKLLSGQSQLDQRFGKMEKVQEGLKVGQQGMIARQRAMFQDDATPLFETTTSGLFQFANQAYLDLVDRALPDLKDRGWEVTIHHQDRARVITEFAAAVAAKRTYEDSFRIRSRTGETYMVKCIAKPLICEDNVITGYLGKYVTYELMTKPN